jgi:hypothetical protein
VSVSERSLGAHKCSRKIADQDERGATKMMLSSGLQASGRTARVIVSACLQRWGIEGPGRALIACSPFSFGVSLFPG